MALVVMAKKAYGEAHRADYPILAVKLKMRALIASIAPDARMD
jgi:hypothetical protein